MKYDKCTSNAFSNIPRNSTELREGHGYYWWISDKIKLEKSKEDDWSIIYWHHLDEKRKIKGWFIGPITNEYFKK